MKKYLALVFVWFITACDSTTAPEPAASISITSSATSLFVGQQAQLSAVVRGASGTELAGRTVTWTSSNDAVASVSSAGVVTANAPGSARIIASAEGLQSDVAMTVAIAAASAVLNPLQPLLYAGTTLPMSLILRDKNGAVFQPGPVAWTTSDASKVAVSNAGVLTAGSTAPATAEIRAAANGVTTSVQARVIRVTSVALGDFHGCSVETTGDAYCWGRNVDGELGIASEKRDTSLVPLHVAGTVRFTKISAGGRHTCALSVSGAAYCWGFNGNGEIGDGTRATRNAPVPVSGGLTYSEIAAGTNHTCGIASDGTIYCWGNGVLSPTKVASSVTLHGLTAGLGFNCGLAADGAAYCWGTNNRGELGNIEAAFVPSPFPVEGGHRFSSIDAGGSGTCAAAIDGQAWCWGSLRWNFYATRSFPERVPGMPSVKSVSLSDSHLCALTSAGAGWCIGEEGEGELGNGLVVGVDIGGRFTSSTATAVASQEVFDSIYVGWGSSCAISQKGVPFCWAYWARIGAGPVGVQWKPVVQALPLIP